MSPSVVVMMNCVLRLLIPRQARGAATYKAKHSSSTLTAEKTAEEEFKAAVQSKELDHDAWREVRKNILRNSKFYSKVNVDATILGLCGRHGSLEVGRSFMRYLEHSQVPMTAAIAGKYLKLFKLTSGEISLDPEESQEVLRVCSSIRERYPVLDASTAENLIHAICMTGHWKDSLGLLKLVKEFSQPSHAAFNDIAQAAFRHGQHGLAVRVLEDGITAGRLPSAASLLTWIKYNGQDVEQLLFFLQRHTLVVPEQVATELKRHLERLQVKVDMSSVSRNKSCGSCRTHLDEITLNADEFRQLQAVFHEKVLIQDNIFIKSTPQEFNDFQVFLEKTGPYDVVIDGLNVAYSVGANKPVNQLSGHILAAMKYFTQEKKRVLILGRDHMKRWPGFIKKVESNNGQAHLISNLSQDDPFFIYAALQSGPNCDIFSRDLLRTWAHQLGPELGPIFRRWQRIHQYSYKTPTTANSPKLFVQPPMKFKIEAHKNTSGFWHVPWTEEGHDYAVNRIPEVPFDVPARWMCFAL